MMKGGYEAGKAALTGRDPSAAYAGSMMKDMGNLAANSGIDAQMKKIAPEMNQYRGPNAKDIRQDPAFKKASPEQQAQALKDFEAIKNLPDDQWNYVTSGNALKQAGATASAAGQDMIDQKDWGKGRRASHSSETNKLFGLDPTRPATDAEFNAAAKGTTPAAPAAQPTPAAPAAKPAPTTPPPPVKEEGDDELQKLKEFLQKRY
jgi:hypothetical protein